MLTLELTGQSEVKKHRIPPMKQRNDNEEREELLARFVCAIESLVSRSREDLVSGLATKHDLCKMEERIMATIQEFADRVNTAFDEIGTAVDGVVTDIQWLKDKITELQNTPGPISPEDQARLDALEARAAAAVTKVKALDASTETPPAP